MKLLAILYRNTKLFEDAFFRLDFPGVVGIQGRNLNSRQVATNDDTNGVGKSLLLGGIPLVLFERMSTSSPSKSKLSFFSRTRAGYVRLWLEKDSDIYMIELDSTGKYSLFKNGESYSESGKKLKIADASAMIEQLVNVSEREYHTRVAVSLQHSDFLRNKGSDRVDTLAHLFGFSHFDDLSLLLKKYAEEKGLTKLAGKLESCASRVQRATDSVNKFPATLQDYTSDLEDIRLEMEDLRQNMPAGAAADISYARKRRDHLLQVKDSLLSDTELAQAHAEIAKLENDWEQVTGHLVAVNNWNDVQKKLNLAKAEASALASSVLSAWDKLIPQSYSEKMPGVRHALTNFSSYSAKQALALSAEFSVIDSLAAEFGVADGDLAATCRSARLFLDQVSAVLNKNTHVSDFRNKLDTVYEKLAAGYCGCDTNSTLDALDWWLPFHDSRPALDVLDPQHQLPEDTAILSVIATELADTGSLLRRKSSVSKLGTDTCPTCGGAIPLHELQATLSAATQYQDALSELQELVQGELANWRHASALAQQERCDAYSAFLFCADLCKLADTWHLATQYLQVPKPAAPGDAAEIKELLREWRAYVAPTETCNLANLEQELASLDAIVANVDEAKLAEVQQHLAQLQREYDETQRSSALLSAASAELAAAQAEMAELEKVRVDAEAVGFLKSFYAPGGARTDMLQEAAAQLESAYNEYKYLLYSEDSAFSIRPQDKTLSIIWSRNGGSEDDVWDSSGSERRRFDLLNLLSLNMLLSPPGLVVLDEMESALGDANVTTYLQQYLPQLQSVVDTVFLISPLAKVVSAAQATITVTKNGQFSTIEVSDPALQVKTDLVSFGYESFL